MKKRIAAAALAGAAMLWAGWAAAPVYSFLAENGDAPLPPWGWIDRPAENASFSDAAQGYEQAGREALGALERRLAMTGAPGISAAVAIGGEIVWTGGAGYADLEDREPVGPHTVFRIGSTAKALTATALARLVQQGVVDLDAPIALYIDDLPNEAWSAITPRQLASHMAGLPDYEKNSDWAGLYQSLALRTAYDEPYKALEMFDSSDMLCAPGTCFRYTSYGTVLLGAALAGAAGKPYLDVMRDEVFAPLAMAATVPTPPRPDRADAHATPYQVEGERVRRWRTVDLSHRLPGGGFASTPSDVARLGAAWLDDAYIAPETRAEFWTPQRLADGSVNEQDYALGFRWREWEVEGVGLARNANHGGVSRGGQCWLLIFPDYDMAIAVAINAKTREFRDFGMVYEELLRAFAPG